MSSIRNTRWMWRVALIALFAVLLHAGAGTVTAFHKARLIALGFNDLVSVCFGGSDDGISRPRAPGGHCSFCVLSGAAPLQSASHACIEQRPADTSARVIAIRPVSGPAPHRADQPRAPPALA